MSAGPGRSAAVQADGASVSTAGRFAVYWVPDAAHPLWAAGCGWLGRDASAEAGPAAASAMSVGSAGSAASAGAASSAPAAPPRAHVAAPARYGFHATLQAPMHLADGVTPHDLRQAVAAVAAQHAAFAMPMLEVAWLHDFLALRPCQPPPPAHPLRRLADACVRGLDPLRARPTEADRARRQADGALDDAQQALLARWGYPHVFDHWRFHMTLSERFADRDAPEALAFAQAAREAFAAALAMPLASTSVALFHEPAPGAPFRLIERIALRAAP